MKDFINKILGSLDTSTENSFSARKLSALIVIILVVILHVKWFTSTQWQYIGEVLFLDFSFTLVCLGLATWQSVQNKKIDKAVEDEIK